MRIYIGKEAIAADPELAAFMASEEARARQTGDGKGVQSVRPFQEVRLWEMQT